MNNEKARKNPAYKANLLRLERFVMIRFSEDTIVVPKDSAWFGAFREGTRVADNDVVPCASRGCIWRTGLPARWTSPGGW